MREETLIDIVKVTCYSGGFYPHGLLIADCLSAVKKSDESDINIILDTIERVIVRFAGYRSKKTFFGI